MLRICFAIEEFKDNRGNNAERERIHEAYAVVFSAMCDEQAELARTERPPIDQQIDKAVATVHAFRRSCAERSKLRHASSCSKGTHAAHGA